MAGFTRMAGKERPDAASSPGSPCSPRLAFTMAAFNVLVQWHGFQPNASGFVPLSIAEFGL